MTRHSWKSLMLTMRNLQTLAGTLMHNARMHCCMALLLSCSWGHAAAVESMLQSTSLFLLSMMPVS